MLQNDDFIQDFIDEATVHIENTEASLLKISEKDYDPENINIIFRAVHSIKGSGGFFSLKKLVKLSHIMESVLGEIRNEKIKITQEIIDVLLLANDCLKSMVNDINNSEDIDISKHLSSLSLLLNTDHQILSDSENSQKSSTINEHIMDGMESVHDDIKHGYKLFMIAIPFSNNSYENNTEPINLIKSFKSIGKIIASNVNIDKLVKNVIDEDILKEPVHRFVISSVLEKNLLLIVLKIPSHQIAELSSTLDEKDINCIITNQPLEVKKDTQKNINDQTLSSTMKNDDIMQNSVDVDSENSNTQYKMNQPSQSVVVEDSIRVHVSLLNNLLNLASEMVLGRNQLLQIVDKNKNSIPGIEAILQNIDRITTELQEKVMQTRMQPISNIFNKFPRMIRDLAKKLGKEMDLKMQGSEVELDKSIIEALGDPLTHLIRNSIDHGIELPHKREALGKRKIGLITLKAYHEGGYVNIDVLDDGGGIDLENVRKKALDKNLVTHADLQNMSDQDVMKLLFNPGFSTADVITDISGRGVGMDVVKTNIEKLGGTIEMYSTLGAGTTIRLILPLTLAIIPSLIVDVGGQHFALPQINLQEIVRIKEGDENRRIEYLKDAEVLRLRGRLLPILHLADILDIKPQSDLGLNVSVKTDSNEKTRNQKTRNQKNEKITRILVIKIGIKRFGIAVDSIHGSEEILVKPLPIYIKECKCYSGVTIMGDGKTAIILDPEGISQKANLKFIDTEYEKAIKEIDTLSENIKENQDLLLFKCSGDETFAIDLSLVSRVEELEASQIERIGSKEYIQFRNDALRIIRPEELLPITRGDVQKDKYFVIIPKLADKRFGVLTHQIKDAIQIKIQPSQSSIKAVGILGSTIINDQIVLLINLYELFELAEPETIKIIDVPKESNKKEHILLVEDTPFFQELGRSYLEAAGYKVLIAQNGKEALDMLNDYEFDAIISDIQMPIMDGFEMIKKIREDKNHDNIPVIAVTSLIDNNKFYKIGIEAGFDSCESKIDRDKLLDKLQMVIKKRR